VDKRVLVQASMGGTQPEDLWIAHFAAARTRRDPGALLDARAARGEWKAVLSGAGALSPALDAALARGASDAELAGIIVDETLLGRLGADPGALRAVRAAGASSAEAIVATIVSLRLGAPAAPLVVQVKAGKTTWGSVLKDAGLAPKELDAFVRASIR
jgi:hypothetical protein